MKRIRNLYICLIILALNMCLVSCSKADHKANVKNTEEAKLTTSASTMSTEESTYKSSIDFEQLKKTNPDIYAWLTIPDTDISYPIVQSATDNDYYLEHTVEGEEGLPGSIYTYNDNGKNFDVFNTIIYGHNMKNGSMFGSLKAFRDETFFKEHPEIIIYTEKAEIHYDIYAAVVFSDDFLLDTYPQDNIEGRQNFIDDISQVRDLNSHINDDVMITVDDCLITLSTCISGEPDHRYLIVAVEESR